MTNTKIDWTKPIETVDGQPREYTGEETEYPSRRKVHVVNGMFMTNMAVTFTGDAQLFATSKPTP